jgi:hypothetical protein
MTGFAISNDTLLDRVVPMAAGKSKRWRVGFLRIISAFNMTAGRELSIAYDLPHEMVSNNSQRSRIAQAQEYLAQGAGEELEGYLAGWLAVGARNDFQQVIWADGEGPPADPSLRRLMHRYLEDGKLDRIF